MSNPEKDQAARLERARQIGLFRYMLIREAADSSLTPRQRGALVRRLATEAHTDPAGRTVRITRWTLDRWIASYRESGFDALVPSTRQSQPRTPPEIFELAAALKKENPDRSAAQVRRILHAQLGWAPDERTLQRMFIRTGLTALRAPVESAVFGRFEAGRPNEIWTGDALHGPRVNDRKTYLFAFLDDQTRAIVGHRWGFAEDTVRLAAALRPALAARGVPEYVYVDNGSAFVDSWLLRACAKLGIKLVHSAPGRPQGRGKIERFFRTVNSEFVVEIAAGDGGPGRQVGDLAELNRLFTAWSRPSITAGCTPKPAPHPWRGGWKAPRSRFQRRRIWLRRSAGRSTAPSPKPRSFPCTATVTRSTPVWSDARWSSCSTRST
jgi:putative transposase